MRFGDSTQRGLAAREIVIALVLLTLVGILMVPYFLSQKKAVDRQVSANNLKQWGIALNLFMIENDNQLPTVGSDNPHKKEYFAWYNSLPPYLNIPGLTETPPDGSPRSGDESLWIDPSAKSEQVIPADKYYFTYGMNRWIQPNPDELSYKVFDLADPSSLVFMTEVNGVSPAATAANVEARHRNKNGEDAVHVLFADGHVEIISKESLVDNPVVADPREPIGDLTWIPYQNAPEPK